MVLDLGGCPGVAKIDLRTAYANRHKFYYNNNPKIEPKGHHLWRRNGIRDASKNSPAQRASGVSDNKLVTTLFATSS